MLKVPLFRQRAGHCGPAALKILLGFFKIKATHAALAERCRTTPQDGTTPANLANCLRSYGFSVTAEEYGNWDKLNYFVNKKRVPVIIDWFSNTDGHYS